jgi:UDP-2,4-diacetamido-2,4,6-trideoxy-beta-L-altropyranose hydrolase
MMLRSSGTDVRVRPATSSDEELLLTWANEKLVRRYSFKRAQISPADHRRWLTERLADPGCILLIGENDQDVPVGQVRFEAISGAESVVNVSVDARFRGAGVGTLLLRNALRYWRVRERDRTVVAEVVLGNEASRRLFLRAGFIAVVARRRGSMRFELRATAENSRADAGEL